MFRKKPRSPKPPASIAAASGMYRCMSTVHKCTAATRPIVLPSSDHVLENRSDRLAGPGPRRVEHSGSHPAAGLAPHARRGPRALAPVVVPVTPDLMWFLGIAGVAF